MILDSLETGDCFLFEESDEEFCHYPVNGEPMVVRAVSLPWVSFSPMSRPNIIYGANINHCKISRPSDDYTNAWRGFFAHVWLEWHQHCLQVRKKMEESNQEPTPEAKPEPEQKDAC